MSGWSFEASRHRGIEVWADSRKLAAGDPLEASIAAAIDRSTHLVAVLSQNAVNSPWVKKEIEHALQSDRGIKVIPLLVDPIGIGALGLWFEEEPVALKLEIGPGGIDAALPDLLSALGRQLPNGSQPAEPQPTRPMADLLLRLSEPGIEVSDGKRRAAARAELIYRPADKSPEVTSRPYRFTAPLGAIEADDLRWYLERWSSWPSDHFRARAEAVEAALPEWGRGLYAELDQAPTWAALEGWRGVAGEKGISRRFTVQVDAELMEGSSEQQRNQASESAIALLALPWELLHDQRA